MGGFLRGGGCGVSRGGVGGEGVGDEGLRGALGEEGLEGLVEGEGGVEAVLRAKGGGALEGLGELGVQGREVDGEVLRGGDAVGGGVGEGILGGEHVEQEERGLIEVGGGGGEPARQLGAEVRRRDRILRQLHDRLIEVQGASHAKDGEVRPR